jgi:carbonic anhydrase
MLERLLEGNARYVETFGWGGLGPRPAAHLAVVTCMDTRIDVYPMLGLHIGDAHVIRNAGGRVTDDVIRSLVVSIEILGTDTVAVIQHTDCGMAKVTNAELRRLLHERRGLATADIDFLPFDDHADAMRNDVQLLRSSPYLPRELTIYGLLYDVETGGLTKLT